MKNLKTKLLITAILTVTPVIVPVTAEAAGSSICNSMTCNNPQVSTVFGQSQDRLLDRSPAPNVGPICNVVNDWRVSVVTAIVGKILNVTLVYTLIPIVVCR